MSGKNDDGSCFINGKEYRYWHGFFVEVGPDDYVIPDEFVDLRDAVGFAEGCSLFAHDRGVGWRTWWVLLYDDVHHKLLELDSDFTGHQLGLDIRHVFTGLTRVEHVDQGGDPKEILDPWKWMMRRRELRLCQAMGSLHRGGAGGYGPSEDHFMTWWAGTMPG
jgi:hypothetical protein